MKLGYWNCRGLTNPIRMVLCYANVDFEETVYDLVNGRDDWFEKDKKNLGGEKVSYHRSARYRENSSIHLSYYR